jgi:ribosomal protein L37E
MSREMSKQEVPELGMQCQLCGHFIPDVKEPPPKCPECGCPRFRKVDGVWPRDQVTEESVAHLKKHVENCWNYEMDSRTGKTYHALRLKWVLDKRKAYVKDAEKARIVLQQVCAECGLGYAEKHIPMTRIDVMRALAKDNSEIRELLKEFIK